MNDHIILRKFLYAIKPFLLANAPGKFFCDITKEIASGLVDVFEQVFADADNDEMSQLDLASKILNIVKNIETHKTDLFDKIREKYFLSPVDENLNALKRIQEKYVKDFIPESYFIIEIENPALKEKFSKTCCFFVCNRMFDTFLDIKVVPASSTTSIYPVFDEKKKCITVPKGYNFFKLFENSQMRIVRSVYNEHSKSFQCFLYVNMDELYNESTNILTTDKCKQIFFEEKIFIYDSNVANVDEDGQVPTDKAFLVNNLQCLESNSYFVDPRGEIKYTNNGTSVTNLFSNSNRFFKLFIPFHSNSNFCETILKQGIDLPINKKKIFSKLCKLVPNIFYDQIFLKSQRSIETFQIEWPRIGGLDSCFYSFEKELVVQFVVLHEVNEHEFFNLNDADNYDFIQAFVKVSNYKKNICEVLNRFALYFKYGNALYVNTCNDTNKPKISDLCVFFQKLGFVQKECGQYATMPLNLYDEELLLNQKFVVESGSESDKSKMCSNKSEKSDVFDWGGM